ncbi:MAG: J domain-containing protein [Pseudomonadota bacterium]
MNDAQWQLLGIEPTESERDVKRAYARKVKEIRPDEKPTEFQALHEAYKAALFYCQHPDLANQIGDPDLIYIEGDPSELQNDEAVETEDVFEYVEPIERLTDAQQTLLTKLESDIDDALTHHRGAANTDAWHFIVECPELLDNMFRFELGKRVLAALLVYEQSTAGKSLQHAVTSDYVVTLLDDIFHWSSNIYAYADENNWETLQRLMGQIDYGLKQPIARPVGGRIIEQKDSRRPVDRRTRSSDSGNMDWIWVAWIVFWGFIVLGRNCSGI